MLCLRGSSKDSPSDHSIKDLAKELSEKVCTPPA